MIRTLLVLITLLSGPARANDFSELVTFFQGQWQCGGHFADGSTIFSDEAFEPLLEKLWLQQVHHDHPPNIYHAYSIWGVDKETGGLTLTIHDSFGGIRIFTSQDWKQPSITFDASPVLGRAEKKARFIYVRRPPDSYSFEYLLAGGPGQWRMIDHVDCKRARP